MLIMAEARYIEGWDCYALSEMVGRGGFATVWRARSLERGRDVAVKVIPVYSRAERSRAMREGQIAEGLKHKNIVEPLEVIPGEYEVYLITEYVDGVPLDVAAKDYTAEDVIDALVQILEALVHAHERGIIHRDIKPQNVLVNDRGQVKLTDFGIAYRAGDTRLTQIGFAVGTPGYIAPETLDGDDPSALSDIYAVGATARTLLASQPEEPPQHLLEFINRTTSPNPLHRPQSAREALKLLTSRKVTGRRGFLTLPAVSGTPAVASGSRGQPGPYAGYVLRGVNGLVAGWLGYLGVGLLFNGAGAVGAAVGFGLAGFLLPRLGALGVIVALAVALLRSGSGLGMAVLLPAVGGVWIFTAGANAGAGSIGRLPLGPLLAVPLQAVGFAAGLPFLLGTLMRPAGAALSAAAGGFMLAGYEITRGTGWMEYLGVAPAPILPGLAPLGLARQLAVTLAAYPGVVLQAGLWAFMAAAISVGEKAGRWMIGALVAAGGGVLGYGLWLSATPEALSKAVTALGLAAIIYIVVKYLGSWSKG